VYAHSWYLNSICAQQWSAIVSDDYQVLFPFYIQSKWGFHYSFQKPFVQQLGIFGLQEIDEKLIAEIFNALPKNIRYIEVNLQSRFNLDWLSKWGELTVNTNIELDLNHTYDLIRKNYSQNLKRNLKKALANPLEIVDCSPDQIVELYQQHNGKKFQAISQTDVKALNLLINNGIILGKARSVGVRLNNTLVAGAFFILSDHRIIFLFSGLSDLGKQSGAMFFLLDQFIQKYAHQPIILDFEGSNKPDVARFYQSFGGVVVPYPTLKINRLPFWLKWLKK
jgi:hypothetical protein